MDKYGIAAVVVLVIFAILELNSKQTFKTKEPSELEKAKNGSFKIRKEFAEILKMKGDQQELSREEKDFLSDFYEEENNRD